MPLSHPYHAHTATTHDSLGASILHTNYLARIGKILLQAKEITKESKLLAINHAIYSAGAALGAIFINLFIWNESHNFKILIHYHIIQYLIIFAIFLISGLFLSKINAKTLSQIGLISLIAKSLLFVILKENSIDYIWLLGILSGIGRGFYWSGTHVLEYTFTKKTNRDAFFGFKTSLIYLASILAPGLGALAVTFGNYYLLFGIMATLFLISAVLLFNFRTLYLPKMKLESLWKPFKSFTWRMVSIRESLGGIESGSTEIITATLVFVVLGNELDLGILNSVFTLIGALVSIIVGGTLLNKIKKELTFGKIGALMISLSGILFIAFFNIPALIISSLISVFARPFFSVGLASSLYKALDKNSSSKEDYYEYITIAQELPLALGRTLAAGLLLIILSSADIRDALPITKTWYIILSLIPLAYWYFTKKFEKNLSKD